MKNCTDNMFDRYRNNKNKQRKICRTQETSKVVLSGMIAKTSSQNK